MEEFWLWFDEKRGNLSVREVERRGEAPRGRISNVYRKKEPSALVCETIADALGLSREEVFRRAGLLLLPEGRGQLSLEEMIREIWERVVAPAPGRPAPEDITGPVAGRVLKLMELMPAYWQELVLEDALKRLDEYTDELSRLREIATKVSFEERKNALLDLAQRRESGDTESDSCSPPASR